MTSWKDFEKVEPDLAAFGKKRFTSNVAYLGTIQKNGYPRVHPVTPIISTENLFLFMEPTSPKGKDIVANGKYMLHSLVTHSSGEDGEFWVRGTGHQVTDPNLRNEAIASSSYKPAKRYILFQLFLEEVGSTVYGNERPVYKRWKSE